MRRSAEYNVLAILDEDGVGDGVDDALKIVDGKHKIQTLHDWLSKTRRPIADDNCHLGNDRYTARTLSSRKKDDTTPPSERAC